MSGSPAVAFGVPKRPFLYVRHRSMSPEIALGSMSEAEGILGDRDYEVSSEIVLALTKNHSISAYDAEYVSLAKALSVPLNTTDRKILREFKNIAPPQKNSPGSLTATPLSFSTRATPTFPRSHQTGDCRLVSQILFSDLMESI